MYIAVCEDSQIYIDGMIDAIDSWKNERCLHDIYVKVYISAEDLWYDWECECQRKFEPCRNEN